MEVDYVRMVGLGWNGSCVVSSGWRYIIEHHEDNDALGLGGKAASGQSDEEGGTLVL